MRHNNIRQKTKSFNRTVRNTRLRNQDIRSIYDDAMQVQFGNNELPIEIREEDVKRFMVNQIRHRCTNYNRQVRLINSIDSRMYSKYKNIVLNMIADEYPSLLDECNRQKKDTIVSIHVSKGAN